ncbi:MAG: 2-amino-4-hydroxy-6-hydroxymethyldihydropteridine diphosphokinase [Bacteroidetes bacterium]|nr:2-amino-4-hydroxy-6-hydroxymethyldihydropteridine diphosphokinase [Bacteroidota bacterium]
MNTAYLLLGGNIGNKSESLKQAINLIAERLGFIAKTSSIYITAAWGNENQPEFYNQAIEIKTERSSTELLKTILEIEESLGRNRSNDKWQERTIDIDILFFNDEIIDLKELKIPHPFIQVRKFVLIPLNEIAKELIHPVLMKTIARLLEECEDKLEVKLKT